MRICDNLFLWTFLFPIGINLRKGWIFNEKSSIIENNKFVPASFRTRQNITCDNLFQGTALSAPFPKKES